MRSPVTRRITTNKAQETPHEYRDMIVNFLCFNGRNSQLRDSVHDHVWDEF